ncbi:MAG: aldo/keto reductase [Paracoccaceae bacterium]
MTHDLTSPDGTPISRFCFGAMQFGRNADEAAAADMFAACRDAGINFFDTAYVYNEGRSEEILGRLAAKDRDKLFIATKCANGETSDRALIHSQFDQSLKRLGMDSVDLLYIHMWNDATPLEETFETLAGLVQSGKTRFIGVSNYAAWQVMKANQVAKSFGIEIAMLQPMYNLVKRQVEVEILPMARSEGFAVCPYSPLGGGLLTGKYAAGQSGRLETDKMYAARYAPDWMRLAAADLAGIAAELGTSAATLAVAWVARNRAVTAPIISARSAAQLQPSLDAMRFDMDDALYARISAVSPAPPPATDRLEEA